VSNNTLLDGKHSRGRHLESSRVCRELQFCHWLWRDLWWKLPGSLCKLGLVILRKGRFRQLQWGKPLLLQSTSWAGFFFFQWWAHKS